MKIKSHSLLCILATIALSSPLSALSVNAQKAVSKTWNPNLKNGMYRNPVIDADYSDPDVCRVGNDYYMTSSSFQCFPGLADSAQHRPSKLGDYRRCPTR